MNIMDLKLNDRISIVLKKEVQLMDLTADNGFDLNKIKNLDLDENIPYILVGIITHSLNDEKAKIFKIKDDNDCVHIIPSFIISKVTLLRNHQDDEIKIFYNERDALDSEFKILDIKEDLTLKLFEKIKPIVKEEDEKFYLTKPVHPINEAFTWNQQADMDRPINEKLVELDTIYVLHSCYYAFYKGSMEEVFASLQYYPKLDEVDFIRAFFMDAHPSGNGVISKVKLYKKEEKNENS